MNHPAPCLVLARVCQGSVNPLATGDLKPGVFQNGTRVQRLLGNATLFCSASWHVKCRFPYLSDLTINVGNNCYEYDEYIYAESRRINHNSHTLYSLFLHHDGGSGFDGYRAGDIYRVW